jgi:uncharacterized membrane protein
MPLAARKRFIRRTIAPIRVLCYLVPGSGALLLAFRRYGDVFSIRFHAVHSLLLAGTWGLTWGALHLAEKVSPWFLGMLAGEMRFGCNIGFLILWACLVLTAFYGGRSIDLPLLRWLAVRLARKHPRRPTATACGGTPYLLDGNDGTGRYYCVRRKGDRSNAGNVRQTERGWVVEDTRQVEYENIPPFPSRADAALFLYMQGRAYKSRFDIGQERIDVRVSPNRHSDGSEPALWAASLHGEDGRPAGRTRCAGSVDEAKIAGVQCAYYGNLPPEVAQSKSERAQWEDVSLSSSA